MVIRDRSASRTALSECLLDLKYFEHVDGYFGNNEASNTGSFKADSISAPTEFGITVRLTRIRSGNGMALYYLRRKDRVHTISLNI